MSALNLAVPVVFGAISLGIYGTFDYMSRAQASPGGMSVGEYAQGLFSRAEIVVKDSGPKEKTLAEIMPAAPDGWTRRATAEGDYNLLTGIAPRELSAEEKQRAAEVRGIEEDLQKNPMFRLMQASASRGFSGEAATYLRGNQMSMVNIVHTPARVTQGLGGAQIGMMLDMMDMEATFDAEEYISVNGLVYHVKKVRKSETAREFTAAIGRQIDVKLISNARDEHVIEMLMSIDPIALNARLAEPLETIGPDVETTLLEAALASQPVAPLDMRPVRVQAAELQKLPGLATRDTTMLNLLIIGTVDTRREAQDYVDSLDKLHPKVMDLLTRARSINEHQRNQPATAATAATAGAPQAGPKVTVIRRGTAIAQGEAAASNCGLQVGARRCVVDDGTDG